MIYNTDKGRSIMIYNTDNRRLSEINKRKHSEARFTSKKTTGPFITTITMWVTLDLVTFYHKFNTICCETMPKERSRVCLRNNSCQLCQYKRHFIISTISTVCVSLASTAICHHKAPKTINWATTMTYMTSWKKYI